MFTNIKMFRKRLRNIAKPSIKTYLETFKTFCKFPKPSLINNQNCICLNCKIAHDCLYAIQITAGR